MEFFKAFDIHKYVFALEHGASGYKHWQVRFRVSDSKANSMFQYLKTIIPQAHIEKSNTWCDYERKEGWFHDSRDTPEVIRQRYAPLYQWQREAVNQLKTQNNREIDVWYSKEGSKGKSHLCAHLYENGAVYVCPEDDHIARTVCSAIKKRDEVKTIVIDIPRNSKWSERMYTDLEHLKDGIIQDPRYETDTRNISGTKILVVTNTKPTINKLSADRWRITEVR